MYKIETYHIVDTWLTLYVYPLGDFVHVKKYHYMYQIHDLLIFYMHESVFTSNKQTVSAQSHSQTTHSQQVTEPLINTKLGKIHCIQSLGRFAIPST